ncbi:hypothetical protein BpHYR1_046212 [Brachionus plicatilis]|uniref:Uncharacterized protein n=1 Tax=Brachionus plicatilis TaxID=10195 RepID=A0A3M7SMX9_BRAPC|nr:hypothetical protein BpHYR1_046212 [Brachionus plicatilis]
MLSLKTFLCLLAPPFPRPFPPLPRPDIVAEWEYLIGKKYKLYKKYKNSIYEIKLNEAHSAEYNTVKFIT